MNPYFTCEQGTLYQGDCLEVMKHLPEGSVDLVLTDPPYGTTKCKWDNVLPFEPKKRVMDAILAKTEDLENL